jgi:hypothetical protein
LELNKYSLEGVSELENALKQLPADLRQKILKSFIRKVGKKFIVDELKTRLHYKQELIDSIKVVKANDDKNAIQAGVTSKGYKLRWLDLGTKERATKKGANRGRIIPKNQIQPTIEKQIEPIIKYTQEHLGEEINKNLERRLKRLRKTLL